MTLGLRQCRVEDLWLIFRNQDVWRDKPIGLINSGGQRELMGIQKRQTLLPLPTEETWKRIETGQKKNIAKIKRDNRCIELLRFTLNDTFMRFIIGESAEYCRKCKIK